MVDNLVSVFIDVLRRQDHQFPSFHPLLGQRAQAVILYALHPRGIASAGGRFSPRWVRRMNFNDLMTWPAGDIAGITTSSRVIGSIKLGSGLGISALSSSLSSPCLSRNRLVVKKLRSGFQSSSTALPGHMRTVRT
jgi:hypothetical protein